MEISASPIHTHSPFPVGRGGQLESMEASVNDHFTNRYTKQLQLQLEERHGEGGGIFGSPSVERVFYFVSLFLFVLF